MSDLDARIIEALIVRPGDTLIVRMERSISADQANGYRELIRSRMPGLADVVVMTADGLAVYRPVSFPPHDPDFPDVDPATGDERETTTADGKPT